MERECLQIKKRKEKLWQEMLKKLNRLWRFCYIQSTIARIASAWRECSVSWRVILTMWSESERSIAANIRRCRKRPASANSRRWSLIATERKCGVFRARFRLWLLKRGLFRRLWLEKYYHPCEQEYCKRCYKEGNRTINLLLVEKIVLFCSMEIRFVSIEGLN